MFIIVAIVIVITIVVIMGVKFCGDRGCARNLGDKTRLPRPTLDHYPIDGAKVFNLSNFLRFRLKFLYHSQTVKM